MSEPAAFAYEPPPDMAGSRIADAMKALPLAKQAEILWRALAANASGDERDIRLLHGLLRGLAEGIPRCDPATARTVGVAEFRAEFDL